jgi:predicted dehydrogenase
MAKSLCRFSGGVAVLVEKPMARSVAEADELIAAAARTGAPGRGTHRRFNPAVLAPNAPRRPRFIEVHRLGAFPNAAWTSMWCST